MASEVSPSTFGLKQKTIEQINAVLARYPAVEKAIIYGSRAKGNYRKGSDIDLTLVAPALTSSQLARMWIDIDDLLLPYLIDLSVMSKIDNADLLEHINRVGITFYEKGSPQAISS